MVAVSRMFSICTLSSYSPESPRAAWRTKNTVSKSLVRTCTRLESRGAPPLVHTIWGRGLPWGAAGGKKRKVRRGPTRPGRLATMLGPGVRCSALAYKAQAARPISATPTSSPAPYEIIPKTTPLRDRPRPWCFALSQDVLTAPTHPNHAP